MNLLILGFGRMGLSHCLQIIGILKARKVLFNVFVLESSVVSRIVARVLIPATSLSFLKFSDVQALPDNFFDVSVDAMPPFDRGRTVLLMERVSKYSLIEKPVLTKLDPSKAMSGYVLQHGPLIETLKSSVVGAGVKEINATVETNLNFDSGLGWRSGSAGGVVNEFMGHLLSVPFAIFPKLVDVKIQDVNQEGNILRVSLESSDINLQLKLVENSPEVRKTTYSWRFMGAVSIVGYDGYSVSVKKADAGSTLSMSSHGAAVEYYLRGFDFARQAVALIDNTGDLMSADQLNLIDMLVCQTQAKISV